MPVYAGGSVQTDRAPNGIQLADFDHDGHLDLVTYKHFADPDHGFAELIVAFGAAQGEFTSLSSYPIVAPYPKGVRVGDLNHDGNPDIIVGVGHGAEVFLGDGTRGFQPTKPIMVNGGSDITVAIEVEDFNQDGRDDLALAMYPSDTVVLVETSDQVEIDSIQSVPSGFNTRRIKFFDLNQDGMLDLFVSGYRDPGVWGWFQQASGEFVLSRQYYHDSVNDFTLIDITGDGLLDLVYLPRDEFENEVVIQNGRANPVGFEVAQRRFEISPQTRNPIALLATDLDGDARPDLLVSASGLWLMKGMGQSGLEEGRSLSSPQHLDRPNMMQAADVDQDGLVDIVTSYEAWDFRTRETRYGMRVLFNRCSCIADFDGNGQVNPFDVLDFASRFTEQSMRADLNSDSNFDFFDLSTFLASYNAGCP